MDVLIRTLKPRAQAILNAITSVLFALSMLAFGWFATLMVIEAFQEGYRRTESVLFIPDWIIIIVIPFGAVLLFIQFSRRAYGFIKTGGAMESREEKVLKEQGI